MVDFELGWAIMSDEGKEMLIKYVLEYVKNHPEPEQQTPVEVPIADIDIPEYSK